MIARIYRTLGLPLVQAELTRQSRRRRMHIARCLYLGLLGLFFTMFWLIIDNQRMFFGMSQLVTQLFVSIVWLQFLSLGAAAAHTSGGMILEEKNRDTLEVLLSTPLTSAGILCGKFMSVLLRASLYILAVLPMFGLLMLEGGISPLQILAVSMLTLCMVAWCSSISMLISLINRKENTGLLGAISLMLFYGFFMLLLRQLPRMLSSTAWAGLAPTFSPETWLKLNLFSAMSEVSVGKGAIFSGPDWRMELCWVILSHLGIAACVSLLCLGVGAVIIRPVAQLGKLTLWRAIMLAMFGSRTKKDIPRRRWEQSPVQVWSRQVYAWRSLAPRASPHSRRLGYLMTFAAAIIMTFAPFFFYIAEFTLRYAVLTADEISAGRGIPPLPEHPLLEGGHLAYERSHDRTVIRAGGWFQWHRRVRDSMNVIRWWAAACSWCIGPVIILMASFGAAAALAREKEKKRFQILLSTPLTNSQLATGLIAQGLARHGTGLILAIPVIVITGMLCGALPVIAVMLFTWYTLACGTFFTALGLHFGLTSKTVRAAQTKLGGAFLITTIAWPIIASMLSGIVMIFSAGLRNTALRLFSSAAISLSPLTLAGYITAGCVNHDGLTAEMSGALVSLCLYTAAGLLIFKHIAGNIREHMQKG